MEYLTLPQTDLKVSKIALGCMRIADKSIEEVEELVKTALESGINFFDHADIYGGGKSEELFGEVLKRHPEYRKQMIIQTKCHIVYGKNINERCLVTFKIYFLYLCAPFTVLWR